MPHFEDFVLAVNRNTLWANKLKPGLVAWGIKEQGENRNLLVGGMGELARNAHNYFSLHQRDEMIIMYPRTYHLLKTTEIDNNYIWFDNPDQCLAGLMLFLQRSVYQANGPINEHMTSIGDLLRHITPAFCPQVGYVESTLSFLREAELALRAVGWMPDTSLEPSQGYHPISGFFQSPPGSPYLVALSPLEPKYEIIDGWIYIDDRRVPYYKTPLASPTKINSASGLMLHYTAAKGFDGIISAMQNPNNPGAAQVLIGVDGRVAQLGSFKQVVYHTGNTYYNDNYVGVELEGWGCSQATLGDFVVFWRWHPTGKRMELVPKSECLYAAHRKEPNIWRWWPYYTPAQYAALRGLIPAWECWRGLEIGTGSVIGHDYDNVAWDRLDTGPALMWSEIGR